MNDLDDDKFKTVPGNLKKLSDAVDNKVVKYTNFNTLNIKASHLEKKIADGTTLIPTNQYNIDKPNSERILCFVSSW